MEYILKWAIRILMWTVALGTVFGTPSTASIAYGFAWIALGLPGVARFDPFAMILVGATVLLTTLYLAIHRTSAFSVLPRTMRREVSVLEAATERARQEGRSIGIVAA